MNALMITPEIQKMLSHARQFELLHVFDSVCNLIDQQDGFVISLISENLPKSPHCIVIPVQDMRHFFINGDYRGGNQQVITPTVKIDTANASIWDARLNLGDLPKIALEALLVVAKDALSAFPDSLARPYLRIAPSDASLYQCNLEQMGQVICQLLVALAENDRAQIRDYVSQLAGCGIGLTPAGDDWLMGCTLALRLMNRDEIATQIASVAANLTTPLSANWLKLAAEQQYNETWHDLFHTESEQDMQCAMQGLLSQGHSSGADGLTGFVQTLETLFL